MANQFRNLPKEGGSPRQISEVVNNIMEGKINSTGTFTAASGTTSTTVTDRRASVNSVILFVGLDSPVPMAALLLVTKIMVITAVLHTL